MGCLPIIFLDIDGVLNKHVFNREANSNDIDKECVKHFNSILRETEARYVVSSAWRYMIHNGWMTAKGFEYLLQTHGVMAGRFLGITDTDTMVDIGDGTRQPSENERGFQIVQWLIRNNLWLVSKVIAIDDLGTPGTSGELMGIEAAKVPLVRTKSNRGLTSADVKRAIKMLS